MVNTENGSLGSVITNQQLNDLPTFGRNLFAALPYLTPGVGAGSMAYDNNPPIRMSVNGGRAFSQDVLLDGGTIVPANINSWQNAVPVLDSIQEFKIASNGYDAEFGRSTATMNLVTKGGSNEFHGNLYEYFQNEKLNAQEFFANGRGSARPRVRNNLYGGTLGGPIKKNKVFFFMAYETNPTRTVNESISTVPTAAFKQGDFSYLLNQQGVKIYDLASTSLNPAFDASKPATDKNPQYLRTPFAGNIIPISSIDPVAAKAASYFPEPNWSDDPAHPYLRNEQFSTSNPGEVWRINPRVDYNFSQTHSMFFRLKMDRPTYTSRGVWPGYSPADNNASTRRTPAMQALLHDTYVLSSSLVNEFRGASYRDVTATEYPASNQDYAGKLGLKNSNIQSFPVFGFGAADAGYGLGPGNNLNQWQEVTHISDGMTYMRGAHSLKWGGEVRANRINKRTGRGDASGSFGFGGGYTSNIYSPGLVISMADFLLGMPSSYSITPMNLVWGAREKEAAWYVQDDWKISPKLTLNLGIRHDMYFGWHEVNNRYAAFSPAVINPANGRPGGLVFGAKNVNGSQLANLAPRFGIAWTPFGDGKTVIRAGGGIFFAPASTIIDFGDTGQGFENGYVAHAGSSQTDKVTPLFYLRDGGPPAVLPALTPAIANGQNVLYIPPDQKTPATYSWSFTLSRQLPGAILAEASYVGTRSVHLPFQRYLNQLSPDQIGPENYQPLLPYPQFANVKTEFHDAVSEYHAFQIKVEKRYSKGLSWTLAYTLAKSMDNSSLDETTSWGGATFGGSGVQNIYDTRANWALSYFDQRHKLASSFTYELPFGPGRPYLSNGVAGKVVGGWQFNTVLQAHTGTPLEFGMATNNSRANVQIWRPNCIGNPTLDNPTLQRWNNAAAFAAPAPGALGNCGRDLSVGPGFFSTDMSMFKNTRFKTPLNENTNLQFRLEAFNALNRANFGLPNATVGSSQFGMVTGTVGNPRLVQLALKLIF